MKKLFRKEIESELAAQGAFSVKIGRRTISVRERRGRYQIQIIHGERPPAVDIYRSRAIAIDRFQERVIHFRRST